MQSSRITGEEQVMQEKEGGCLCGRIRYRCSMLAMTAVCHCRDCQKQTGTSFSVILGVPRTALAVSGQPAVFDTHGESGALVHRYFCGHCGSPLYSAADAAPDLFFVKAGTLDNPTDLAPQAEFWCDTAQPWLESRSTLPRMPRNPPLG